MPVGRLAPLLLCSLVAGVSSLSACTKEDINRPASSLARDCTVVNLARSGVTDEGLQVLLSFLARRRQVTQLDLSSNRITGEGFAKIAGSLLRNNETAQLRLLRLRASGVETSFGMGKTALLGDAGAFGIAKALHMNRHLLVLDLRELAITARGALALAAALRTNAHLTDLLLDGNAITDEGAAHLERALKSNAALSKLSLAGNEGIASDRVARIDALLLRNRQWRCTRAPTIADAASASLLRCAGAASGHVCEAWCAVGFASSVVAGAPRALCTQGQWSRDGEGWCEPSSCSRPRPIVNADAPRLNRCAETPSGSKCQVHCAAGYAVAGTTKALRCFQGKWNGDDVASVKCTAAPSQALRAALATLAALILAAIFVSQRASSPQLDASPSGSSTNVAAQETRERRPSATPVLAAPSDGDDDGGGGGGSSDGSDGDGDAAFPVPPTALLPLEPAPEPAPAPAPAALAVPELSEAQIAEEEARLVRRKRMLRTRKHVVDEILNTERQYIQALQQLIDIGNALEAAKLVNIEQKRVLFDDLQQIVATNMHFRGELESVIKGWDEEVSTVGDVMQRIAPLFRAYIPYAASFGGKYAALSKLTAAKGWPQFVKNHKRHARISIESIMIQPIQRVPRYGLLLKELLKQTPADHVDHALLNEAVEKISDVATRIDGAVGTHDQLLQRLAIWTSVGDECEGRNVLVEGQARKLLYEGQLIVATSASVAKLWCFLFSDGSLLTGTPRAGVRRSSISLRGVAASAARRLSIRAAPGRTTRGSTPSTAAAAATAGPVRPELISIASCQICQLVPPPPPHPDDERDGGSGSGSSSSSSRLSAADVVDPISIVTAKRGTLHLSATTHARREAWLGMIASLDLSRSDAGAKPRPLASGAGRSDAGSGEEESLVETEIGMK